MKDVILFLIFGDVFISPEARERHGIFFYFIRGSATTSIFSSNLFLTLDTTHWTREIPLSAFTDNIESISSDFCFLKNA
jgi:hypothetical protein